MNKSEITCGRELQWALEHEGINALWVKNRGLIIMSAYYGVSCSVTGRYPIYTFADGLYLLGALRRMKGDVYERSDFLAMFTPSVNRGYYEIR